MQQTSSLASQQLMQQQAAIMAAAAAQGTYLTSPVNVLATQMQQIGGLATPNGIATAAITPTTATLANGKSVWLLLLVIFICQRIYS